MDTPLVVYKASAGSGKTFTLAAEYIRLLIENPFEYQHILAVTFTNKATSEMKNRIMEQLYGIANGLEDSDDYVKAISSKMDVQLPQSEFRSRAKLALSLIIHDYTHFRIETIDSFFQSIIRELAHELDLTANLKVDLNQDEVLAEAVSEIIDNLDAKSQLFKNIIDFIQEKIDEGKNWSIEKEVVNFGKNIFNEKYLENQQSVRDRISDPAFLRIYKRKLIELERKAADEIESSGKKLLAECESHGYGASNFKYASSGVYSTFVKLSKFREQDPGKMGFNSIFGKRAIDCINCEDIDEEWQKADTKDPGLSNLIRTTLRPCLADISERYPALLSTYVSANSLKAHLNYMMLLNVINEKVRGLNSEANRFLLADTAHFLRDIIDESDIPFIYEKTGSRFKHIMIDEFQDTSAMQWSNFTPLLSNSLDADNFCMLVGDVKQSIYRWRNGDWSILNNIDQSKFGKKGQVHTESLDTNFRSAERVIEFNNALFKNMTDILCSPKDGTNESLNADLQQAYSDVKQKVAPKNTGCGYVRIEVIKMTEGKKKLPDAALERLCSTIEELTHNGIDISDIAILVKENKQTTQVTEYMSEHMPEIKIDSDQAYRLDSSSALNLIVMALRAVASPDEMLPLMSLANYYQEFIKCDETIHDDISSVIELASGDGLNLLPKDFTSSREKLSTVPLYELIETISRMFGVNDMTGQSAYMFAFHDYALKYINDNGDDLSGFINYWDERLHQKTIPGGSSSGMKIMTIHKSKGLQFNTVIVPFCEWNTDYRSNDLIWCVPQGEVYSEMPLAPITLSTSLESSIFSEDRAKEDLRRTVDNLNVLYVAFTRAEKNLIIFTDKEEETKGKKGKGKEKEAEKKMAIKKLITVSIPSFMECDSSDPEDIKYTYGTICLGKKETKKASLNVFKQPYTQHHVTFSHHDSLPSFKQSNKSRDFISRHGEDEQSKQGQYISEGLLLHRLFSMLGSAADIDKAVETLDGEGCFSSIEHKRQTAALVKDAFSKNPEASEWFDPHWRTMNECGILSHGEHGEMIEHRPDRVISDDRQTIVIDYKTGKPDESYKKQVQGYMSLLTEMGYKNVSGFLWYVRSGEVIPVKSR